MIYELNQTDPLTEYIGENVSCKGRLLSVKTKKADYKKAEVKIGKNRYLVNIYGESNNLEDQIGGYLTFDGEVKEPDKRRNPGCFDYSVYLLSRDIRLIIDCQSVDVSSDDKRQDNSVNFDLYGRLLNGVSKLKSEYLARVSGFMSKESSGLLAGMMFGDKDGIDEETYETFQKNGVAHILSVSGLHVGIIYGFISMFFVNMRKPFNISIVIVFLILYSLLAELSPSVVRAVLMIAFHLIAKVTDRRYDLLIGTCATAFIMLIFNPLSLLGIGFQLSFLAVLILAFLLPFLNRYIGKVKEIDRYDLFAGYSVSKGIFNWEKIKEKLVAITLPILAIQIGMSVITAFAFNYLSPIGLLMNIPIITIAGLIIPAGIIMMLFAIVTLPIISDAIIGLVGFFMDKTLTLLTEINKYAFMPDKSFFWVVGTSVAFLFLFYLLLFFLTSEYFRLLCQRKKVKYIVVVLGCIVVFSAAISFNPAYGRNNSSFTFVDVGQGDCLHIQTPDGKNILIDGGGNEDYDVGKNTLLPYLLKNGVSKIDFAFVTHLHTDHLLGIKQLTQHISVEKIGVFEGSKYVFEQERRDSGLAESDVYYLSQGNKLKMGKNIEVEIIYPKKPQESSYAKSSDEEDENENSLMIKVVYDGVSVLMTGDIDENAESKVISALGDSNKQDLLKSDILKVGHHGSKYSTSDDFLEKVEPKLSVIQVGKNNYGHPTPEVIEKLNEKGIMIYRNDENGAVMIDVKQRRAINVETMLD